MQPSQAEIGRLLSEKPKDQNELHATMNAALTFLKAAPVDRAPRDNDATFLAVLDALLSYISGNGDTKDDFATAVFHNLSKAREATAEHLEVLLSVAPIYVKKYRIRTTTALSLILKTACSPFGEKHPLKVWQGHSAEAINRPCLIPFDEYYKGPPLEPINGAERNGRVLLLTGESGSGKTSLAHQLAEGFLTECGQCVGVGVYLRSGFGHFVVPGELLSRPIDTATAANKDHTTKVTNHLAEVVVSLLTARDQKALPKDKSVQRVAVVIDESSGIMTYVRGLIAGPGAFAKALHAKLDGTAAALAPAALAPAALADTADTAAAPAGADLTGFSVAIIVAGTGCGVASCDDATSEMISSHPNNFREVQLPVNNSNTKLRGAIFARTMLPKHIMNFLLGRPETEPLTTNPRTLWELIVVSGYFARYFYEASGYFSVTAEAAVGVAHTISAAAALFYLKSNGLASTSEEKKKLLSHSCLCVRPFQEQAVQRRRPRSQGSRAVRLSRRQ